MTIECKLIGMLWLLLSASPKDATATFQHKEFIVKAKQGEVVYFKYDTSPNTIEFIHFGEMKNDSLDPNPNLIMIRVDEKNSKLNIIKVGNSTYIDRLTYEGRAQDGLVVFKLSDSQVSDSKIFRAMLKEVNGNETKFAVMDWKLQVKAAPVTVTSARPTVEVGCAVSGLVFILIIIATLIYHFKFKEKSGRAGDDEHIIGFLENEPFMEPGYVLELINEIELFMVLVAVEEPDEIEPLMEPLNCPMEV